MGYSVMLVKNNRIVDQMYESSERKLENLNCWIKEELDFNIYVFTFSCENEEQLLETYDELNNDLALCFQSNLTKYPEIWNIYLFFFVENEISRDLKYVIEQNKYCSRKIVVDRDCQYMNEKENESFIYNKLFYLEINSGNDSDTSKDMTFKKKIEQKNIGLYNLIENINGNLNRNDITKRVDKFFEEILKDE